MSITLAFKKGRKVEKSVILIESIHWVASTTDYHFGGHREFLLLCYFDCFLTWANNIIWCYIGNQKRFPRKTIIIIKKKIPKLRWINQKVVFSRCSLSPVFIYFFNLCKTLPYIIIEINNNEEVYINLTIQEPILNQ